MDNRITFTSSEAQALTGVSAFVQRDWRRNGFMASGDRGWTRYTIEDLCRLHLFNTFTQSGMGPSRCGRMVDRLVPRLAELVNGICAGTPQQTDAVAVIWANGDIGEYSGLQDAFTGATDDQQAGAVTVISLRVIGFPFGFKLREWLAMRNKGIALTHGLGAEID